jgi:uncharacterized protein HemY
MNRAERAEDESRRLEQLLREGVEKAGNLEVCGFIAWQLSARQLLPSLALNLAQKAVRIEPRNSDFLRALGAARYRNADFESSAVSLNKSLNLSAPVTDRGAQVFLAMAYCQLGRKEAQNTFATTSRASNGRQESPLIQQLEKEAAALLEARDCN